MLSDLGPRPGGSQPLPSTISGVHVYETVVKKSRFIARVAHAPTVAAADEVVAAVRKEYWDARHSCVALVVGLQGDQQRSSDDGEPSGTAGSPMLEVLRHRSMTDVVAVVTRYFGGVLLGAGGLVRAYSSAVSEALDGATLVRRAAMLDVVVTTTHAEAGRTEHALRDWASGHGATFAPPVYTGTVELALLVTPESLRSLEQTVATLSSGAVVPDVRGWRVADLPTP